MKNCLSSGNRDRYIATARSRGKSLYTVALNKQSVPSSNIHFPSWGFSFEPDEADCGGIVHRNELSGPCVAMKRRDHQASPPLPNQISDEGLLHRPVVRTWLGGILPSCVTGVL